MVHIMTCFVQPLDDWQRLLVKPSPKEVVATAANGESVKTKWEQDGENWIFWIHYNGSEPTPITLECFKP